MNLNVYMYRQTHKNTRASDVPTHTPTHNTGSINSVNPKFHSYFPYLSLSKLLELLILCKFVNKKYDYNDYSIFIILKAGYPKNEMLC